MAKSATDIMQEIVFASVIDAITALKAASKGTPNTLLRDLNAVHANTTLADLPPEVQAAIQANVRAAFARLLKDGYSVAPSRSVATPRPAPRDTPSPGPARSTTTGDKKPKPDSNRPHRGAAPRGGWEPRKK